ncbi:Uncharacterized membrane protein [Halogranum amylolyticum]|uniref:Uncharacterized membrane protein n=1 Tax=Halogranum amylolyticum TaxID=660520 RepID=A0A1H8PLK8_9EURY|nr:DUF2243 domain-containing protein [Halogranum amylolyticum]SEO42842.1 Uncharacterized membrane protein [Halogranum amylolyticum]
MNRIATQSVVGAVVFGFGLSGLVDVLFLHHVLQLHHLVSNVYDPSTLSGLRMNILADGLFSLTMLAVAGVGGGLVWAAERRAAAPLRLKPLAGATVLGVGLFDLLDVVVDHMLLGVHHATHSGAGIYDPHWVVVSLLIVGAGAYLYRHAGGNPVRSEAEA